MQNSGMIPVAVIDTEADMNDLTGKPAFDFSLTDTTGQVHRLADFRGNWLLMMFHRHLG